MSQKYVEVKIYNGDVYEGYLIQADPEKILIHDEFTDSTVRIYRNAIVSLRSLGWVNI